MKKFGIDISIWQKDINLKEAKEEGVEFVIIRGAYTGSANKNIAKDTSFEMHYKNAKAVGLDVGVYHFSRACNYEEGVKEANFLYENCLKGKKFEYPIYIDVEDNKYQAKESKDNITKAIMGFCKTLENKGYYVGIYANLNWINNHMNYDELKYKYDFWIASWNKTQPSINTYDYGLWQFGGEINKIRTNKVAGIICDQNYAYKDYPNIMKVNELNGYLKQNLEVEEKGEDTPQNLKFMKYKKGEKVILNGYLYKDSMGNGKGIKKKNYKGIITMINEDGTKPYHIDSLGWVAEENLISNEIISIGDKVKVLKNVTYDGKKFIKWFRKYDVKEVSGDRVVIGKGKMTTCAININNIEKI